MIERKDIPKEIWDNAEIWCHWYLGQPDGTMDETIARAIMVATLVEREACLQAVLDEQLGDDSGNDGDLAYSQAIRHACDAIRKRGEP